VASHFPNPESYLRLVSALLVELDDEWMTGRV
jgi:transposase-like protein